MKLAVVTRLVLFALATYVATAEDEASDVSVLTDAQFPSVVGKGSHVFVKFYAPWCGHCKSLAPVWDKLATAFRDEPSVVIAKLDATTEKEMAAKYEIRGYPTLLFFPAGTMEPIQYQEARTIEALTDFINEKAGTARNPDGSPNNEFGIISDLAAAVDGVDCETTDSSESCLQRIQKALETASANVKDGTSSVFDKAKKFYQTAFGKLSGDASYLKSETARLTELIKDTNVNAAARSYMIARKNILMDLQNRLCNKVPSFCKSTKEEL